MKEIRNSSAVFEEAKNFEELIIALPCIFVSWLSGKRSDMVSRSKGGVSGLGLN
jgi:hypothetical protein